MLYNLGDKYHNLGDKVLRMSEKSSTFASVFEKAEEGYGQTPIKPR